MYSSLARDPQVEADLRTRAVAAVVVVAVAVGVMVGAAVAPSLPPAATGRRRPSPMMSARTTAIRATRTTNGNEVV